MRLIGWPDVLVERKAGRNLQADSAMQLAGNLRGQVKGGLDVSTISQLYGVLSYRISVSYLAKTVLQGCLGQPTLLVGQIYSNGAYLFEQERGPQCRQSVISSLG